MTRDELLERTRGLLPELRERAVQTEQLRRMPDETAKSFREAGLFRALQPARYGGFEVDPGAFLEAGIEVASACASSGWVLGVIGVHSWQMALFPERAQEDVWGDDTGELISSSYAPTGRVERTDGGFRLSGRWSFSSGCDLCSWVFLGGIVPDSAAPAPDMRTFLVPRSDYEIDDVWHVAGLCGTGSKDIVIEDAFVPEHRTLGFREAFELRSPGLAVHSAPLYRIPFGSIFSYAIAAPAIGAAQGALELFREQSRSRYSKLDLSKVSEDPFAQLRLAEAAAEVDDARDRLRSNFDALMGLVRADQPIPLERRTRCRWDAANAVATGVRAVDRLFAASGGRAIFLDNPIQRAFRDVHAMRAHAINNPEKAAQVFGRSEFGLPPRDMLF